MKNTKENSVPRGKFRLVENSLKAALRLVSTQQNPPLSRTGQENFEENKTKKRQIRFL